jgi:hypothetical protein
VLLALIAVPLSGVFAIARGSSILHGAVQGKRRLDGRCVAHFAVQSRPVQR